MVLVEESLMSLVAVEAVLVEQQELELVGAELLRAVGVQLGAEVQP